MRTLSCLPLLAVLSSATAGAQTAPPAITTGTASASVDGSAASKSVLATPAISKAAWQNDGSWGWFVVASSIFVGTGLTSFGLGQTCDDPEGVNSCTRGTSLALWGGIGMAAIGSAIGLVIVQEGRSRKHGLNYGTLKLGPLGEFRLASPPYSGAASNR